MKFIFPSEMMNFKVGWEYQ